MTNFAPYFSIMRRPSNKISVLIFILPLTFALLITSCGKEKSPEGILPQDQLAQMMIDFYLAEARLNSYSIPKDSAIKLFAPLEESVLKKYGVSDSTLQRTYQYYFDHPVQLEKLYEVVIDSLSLRERKSSGQPLQTK